MTIQSLFEGKSTGILRTIKPITDTVIIQLLKASSYFISILSMNVILAYKQTAFSE